MTVSSFIDLKQKYKSSPFRWHVVELFRLELVSEPHRRTGQILTELNLSRTSLRIWNRAYQRYRLRRYYPKSTYSRLMKNDADEVALLKQQLAQTEALWQWEKLKREALETMITIAEKEFNIPIRKKSGPKRSKN